MSDMPGGAWRNLSMDFLGPLPSGEELMVLVDEYSRFPIVEIIRSVSSNTVIPLLDKHLATFGYPDVIKSDNVAPFNSDAFASFAKHSGFRYRRVTEYWPRGHCTWQRTSRGLQQATHEGNPIDGGGAKKLEARDVPFFATVQSNTTHFYQVQSTQIAVRQRTWYQTTMCLNRRQP